MAHRPSGIAPLRPRNCTAAGPIIAGNCAVIPRELRRGLADNCREWRAAAPSELHRGRPGQSQRMARPIPPRMATVIASEPFDNCSGVLPGIVGNGAATLPIIASRLSDNCPGSRWNCGELHGGRPGNCAAVVRGIVRRPSRGLGNGAPFSLGIVRRPSRELWGMVPRGPLCNCAEVRPGNCHRNFRCHSIFGAPPSPSLSVTPAGGGGYVVAHSFSPKIGFLTCDACDTCDSAGQCPSQPFRGSCDSL